MSVTLKEVIDVGPTYPGKAMALECMHQLLRFGIKSRIIKQIACALPAVSPKRAAKGADGKRSGGTEEYTEDAGVSDKRLLAVETEFAQVLACIFVGLSQTRVDPQNTRLGYKTQGAPGPGATDWRLALRIKSAGYRALAIKDGCGCYHAIDLKFGLSSGLDLTVLAPDQPKPVCVQPTADAVLVPRRPPCEPGGFPDKCGA
jgi:hypothetical protein